MRGYVKVVRYLVWLTQLGLSAAVPLVGFILLGTWLHNSKGWGGWTVAAGIVLGLLGAAGSLYNSFKTLHQMLKRDEDKPPVGYNQHE
ncbi:MAG: AtpZ/AtpI family protein [Oscillospiraceae bacterium]|nr:AtpZ/AtpI family protein [Oscillospiraceae bacterium]